MRNRFSLRLVIFAGGQHVHASSSILCLTRAYPARLIPLRLIRQFREIFTGSKTQTSHRFAGLINLPNVADLGDAGGKSGKAHPVHCMLSIHNWAKMPIWCQLSNVATQRI